MTEEAPGGVMTNRVLHQIATVCLNDDDSELFVQTDDCIFINTNSEPSDFRVRLNDVQIWPELEVGVFPPFIYTNCRGQGRWDAWSGSRIAYGETEGLAVEHLKEKLDGAP